MAFCSNCGHQLADGAKFCFECGAPVASGTAASSTGRQAEYDGKLFKCPNCGDILDAYESVCETCGYERRGAKATSSVTELAKKIEAIEASREPIKQGAFKTLYFGRALTKTDEQKISLIKNFPIPNTKEDLFEFLVLSASNIDMEVYDEGNQLKKNSARAVVSEAWRAKFEQAYQKAKLVFVNDPKLTEIHNLYKSTNKALSSAKWRTWKLLGIVWGILIAFIAISGIIAVTVSSSNEKKELARLEATVQVIEEALADGDYKLALMNADRLYYNGNDSGTERDWDIQREYWIDKVIEEAAEDGVILERPAEKAEVSGELTVKYTVLENGDAEITGFSGVGNTVSIDKKIDGHTVVSIGKSAFQNCTTLETVVFWADIKTIGEYAFAGCTALSYINIPRSTLSIEAHAFDGCSNMESVAFFGDPNIGDYAFANCTSITSVNIPRKTEYVGNHAFDGCSKLSNVTVWSDDTVIAKDAFENCPNLKNRPIQE